ncbi:MAG TPA: TetR/AcrR family transcriptional regulator [Homoserinimonas sp.]|nr:TetR/AcrR family transcriptional regulator [Homoserinimonas sp.]
MSSASEFKSIALAEFATAGYAGTSLSRIADLAGLSKSSVLYHYASKEALLEAAIGPAIDRIAAILDATSAQPLTIERRHDFIVGFVDFLLEYPLELNLFINQGASLIGIPVVDRANALVKRLAEYFTSTVSSTEEQMRFGIALGGAAYMLCTMRSLELTAPPDEEIRAVLVTILTELLVPITTEPATRE